MKLGTVQVTVQGEDRTSDILRRLTPDVPALAEHTTNLLRQLVGYPIDKARSLIQKGDFDGHPFRGNQYTDGAFTAETGKPVDLHYLHNRERSHAPVQDFGQALEPAGKYLNVSPTPLKAPDQRWETGTVKFTNPILLPHKDSSSEGWKKDLSAAFGGKTGKALSNAIRRAGYDGVITYDKYGLSESVHLPITKGDVDGHPFRGNQYTDVAGPSEIKGLNRAGFKERYGMEVGTLAKAMLGTTKPRGGRVYFDRTKADPTTGRVLHGIYAEEVKVHGADVDTMVRYFDPETKTVIHEDLILAEHSRGGGAAAKIIDASFRAYDKAGYEKVTLFAGLQLGAYTWAKMGFEYRDADARVEHQDQVRKRVGQLISDPEFLEPAAKQEYDNVLAVLKADSPQANQILSDLKTPELDKLAQHWDIPEGDGLKAGSGFLKHALYYSSYDGVLNLKGPGRVRADRYLKERKKR